MVISTKSLDHERRSELNFSYLSFSSIPLSVGTAAVMYNALTSLMVQSSLDQLLCSVRTATIYSNCHKSVNNQSLPLLCVCVYSCVILCTVSTVQRYHSVPELIQFHLQNPMTLFKNSRLAGNVTLTRSPYKQSAENDFYLIKRGQLIHISKECI